MGFCNRLMETVIKEHFQIMFHMDMGYRYVVGKGIKDGLKKEILIININLNPDRFK